MLITFEGIEGCGKSTQARLLKDHLDEFGVPAVFTREPGGTSIGAIIRRILLDAANSHLSPRAELFLYAADRAQHVDEVIAPALKSGKWVVCDRFFDATTVYQGYARDQDLSKVATINEMACSGIIPDITFLIDCDVKVSLERAVSRHVEKDEKGQDRFERETIAFHEAVREGYLLVARREPSRFVVVDGSQPVAAVSERIASHLRPWISERIR
jgi:dTMP kinase